LLAAAISRILSMKRFSKAPNPIEPVITAGHGEATPRECVIAIIRGALRRQTSFTIFPWIASSSALINLQNSSYLFNW